MVRHEQLKALHKMVWEWRSEMEPHFPTPGRVDSLAFAVTEAAEALDAQLRQNPIYRRNNEKAHTVERELTQCAMMLLTAIPKTWEGWAISAIGKWELKSIVGRVAEHYAWGCSPESLIFTLYGISTIVNLNETLPAELDRMRAKYKPERSLNRDEHLRALWELLPANQDDGPASLNEVANEHVIHDTTDSPDWLPHVIRVKIVGAGNKAWWYSGMIGRVFAVWKRGDNYEVMGGSSSLVRLIAVEDAIVLGDNESLNLNDSEWWDKEFVYQTFHVSGGSAPKVSLVDTNNSFTHYTQPPEGLRLGNKVQL